jgi:hypothetical protein
MSARPADPLGSHRKDGFDGVSGQPEAAHDRLEQRHVVRDLEGDGLERVPER